MGITLIMSVEEAQEQFDEALEELQSAWNSALVCAGNPDELKAEQHELVLAVELLETAVEAVRGEMDEKIEAKADLEALCDRLGIENGELQVIRNKIQEECDALEIENGNFADLVKEAEAKNEERAALEAEKE